MYCPFSETEGWGKTCDPETCPLGRDGTCTFTAITDHLEHIGNVLDQRLEVLAARLSDTTHKLGIIANMKPL